ncbi:hypothetical protein J3323_07670 [Leuconostoc mesenteroides]|uniref:hypothetical protein n=1 Tax=Leuconostoc mesenteroides TaxID=1245 RepID=UPI001CC0CB3E|nr:hypothetical protein [Leuconostoc mesenteroides]MBZ1529777.1 hypothetical protein [Leuconostoc mesenteroides]
MTIKGVPVELGDVFYYKKFPSEFKDLRFQDIAIVSRIVIEDGKYTEIEFESPYGLDLSDVLAVDLTRIGNEQFTYIGNLNTDEFVEVDESGEVFGKITLGNPFSKDNHIEAANANNMVVRDDVVEPVAYFNKFKNNSSNVTQQKVINNRMLLSSTPLYTSDQLQNKIELTKDEFELLAKVCRGIQPLQKIVQHIKVLPDMKWFVRSKAKGRGKYLYLKEPDESITPWYTAFKDMARHFDTKEEANPWTTPDTEAVQLPVEGE